LSAVGTLAWAERTGGRLRRRDRLALLGQGAALQLRTMPARVAARLGITRPGRIDVEAIPIPDTRLAREAEAVTAEMPPYLAAHSHRAYLFGAALGAHDGLSFDPELLYLAALVHDWGLANPPGDDGCFTVASARRAGEAAAAAECPAGRSRVVQEAITLHFNASVGRRHGAEAHLMAAGTVLDVLGLRRWQLDRDTVDTIVARHPRQRFKQEIAGAIRADVARAPACRPAFLVRYAGLARMARRAPFRE
jgi:hypothetical protein